MKIETHGKKIELVMETEQDTLIIQAMISLGMDVVNSFADAPMVVGRDVLVRINGKLMYATVSAMSGNSKFDDFEKGVDEEQARGVGNSMVLLTKTLVQLGEAAGHIHLGLDLTANLTEAQKKHREDLLNDRVRL